MADATVEEVLADAAASLGEPEAEIFNPTVLMPFFGMAYRGLWNLVMKWGIQKARRKVDFLLPAYTDRLNPLAYGVADFGEPLYVSERGGLTTTEITSISNATPRVVTKASHGLSSDQIISIVNCNVTGLNQEWFITVLNTDTFSLNGSSIGRAVTTPGQYVISSDRWQHMKSTNDINPHAPVSRLSAWEWRDSEFRFRGADEPRLLRVTYYSSGAAPDSGLIGFDNCRDFLSTYTAALCAPTRNMDGLANDLLLRALGPSGQLDGSGGYLRDLTIPMLNEKKNRRYRPQPTRQRRYGSVNWW
jgi:hypothetical protein